MQRSVTRIRTSHVGRLPPPKGWEEMPGRLASAEITDSAFIASQVTPAIAETVRRQVEAGIDCIGDGEFWTARSHQPPARHRPGRERALGRQGRGGVCRGARARLARPFHL